MNSTLQYLTDKFEESIFILATGEGDARSRVGEAFYKFWHINIEDFPEMLREDREKITILLTRLGGKEGYIIPENLQRMKNSTATKIAKLMLQIYLQLLELRRNSQRQ